MHWFSMIDAGGVQISSNFKESPEGETSHDATLCPQAAQSTDQISGTSVAQKQHENHVSNLLQSQA